jgi:hypothetical protein
MGKRARMRGLDAKVCASANRVKESKTRPLSMGQERWFHTNLETNNYLQFEMIKEQILTCNLVQWNIGNALQPLHK